MAKCACGCGRYVPQDGQFNSKECLRPLSLPDKRIRRGVRKSSILAAVDKRTHGGKRTGAGRPRKWASDAARKQAERQQRRAGHNAN